MYQKYRKTITSKDFQLGWKCVLYHIIYRKGAISHRRMDPFFAIGYNADIDFEAEEIPRGVGCTSTQGL